MSVLLCSTRKCVKIMLPCVSVKKRREAACDEPKGMEHANHIAKMMRNGFVLGGKQCLLILIMQHDMI